jgi:hypothetical protein
MNSEEQFFQSITKSIKLAQKLGMDIQHIKNNFNRQLETIYKSKIKTKNKKKPMRPPLWISDSSDDDL